MVLKRCLALTFLGEFEVKKVIILNLKTYSESTGSLGERLCEIADEVAAGASKVDVIVCPQATQLEKIASKMRHALVFAQGSEAAKLGQSTGAVTPEAVKAAGCIGTLVNHGERRVSLAEVKEVVTRSQKVGLRVCACAASVEEGTAIAGFSPWAVAVEPPELIGSGISVSSTKPELVSRSVKEIRVANPKSLVLVGAGISTASDVAKSVELGADGVILASAFVKSKDPHLLLHELVEQLK